MEIKIKIEDLVDYLKQNLRTEPEIKEGKFIFKLNDKKTVELKEKDFNLFIKNLGNLVPFNNTAIYSDNTFEVLISRDISFYIRHQLHDGITKEDAENQISYKIQSPTNEYLIYFFDWLYRESNLKSISNNFRFPIPFFLMRDYSEESKIKTVFELIKLTNKSLLTIQVHSGKKINPEKFIKYIDSFLFNISFNSDVSIVTQKNFNNLIKTEKIRTKRTNLIDIECPKRFYINELLYHYQMGLSTQIPQQKYLSFYHVVEHFFEDVFQEDLIERLKNKITHAEFSSKKDSHIKEIIKIVRKAYPSNFEEKSNFSEFEALKITLTKYVDIEELHDQIDDIDKSLIDYYKKNKVSFSGGNCISFNKSDKPKLISDIAKRIYLTRNSIVHSKEGQNKRFKPFEDDSILEKEIPLIRLISEIIIFAKSSIIE